MNIWYTEKKKKERCLVNSQRLLQQEKYNREAKKVEQTLFQQYDKRRWYNNSSCTAENKKNIND